MLIQIMTEQLYRHREARKAYQRKYSAVHSRAARRKVGKMKKDAGSTLLNRNEHARYVRWPQDTCI